MSKNKNKNKDVKKEEVVTVEAAPVVTGSSERGLENIYADLGKAKVELLAFSETVTQREATLAIAEAIKVLEHVESRVLFSIGALIPKKK